MEDILELFATKFADQAFFRFLGLFVCSGFDVSFSKYRDRVVIWVLIATQNPEADVFISCFFKPS